MYGTNSGGQAGTNRNLFIIAPVLWPPFLYRWLWLSLFSSGWVGGASMIIPTATDAYAQRAPNVKEATSQVPE